MGASAPVPQLEELVEALEADWTLRDPRSFLGRAEAVDRLEVHVLDRIDADPEPPVEWLALSSRGRALVQTFADCDRELFEQLRAEIRSGSLRGRALASELKRHLTPHPASDPGYQPLDALIDGVFQPSALPPSDLQPGEPEMVFYQPTPVRVILELIAAGPVREGDVFFDLGSGLGQVCLLVRLLTGATAIGVEFQRAYCDYARRSVDRLGVSGVEILEADARDLDCSRGTIFYLYTPFRGEMLETVLRHLERAASNHPIRVCTFGDCTAQVARQPWLEQRLPTTRTGLCVFHSRS